MQDSKFKIQNYLFLIVFLSGLFFPLISQAGIVPCGTEWDRTVTPPKLLNPCQFCHFFVLINNIIIFLLFPHPDINNNIPLIPTVAALMFVISGFYLLIAGPNPELFSKGKAILTATVIGLIVVFVAWVFLNTFLDFLNVAEWTGLKTWWQIKCP